MKHRARLASARTLAPFLVLFGFLAPALGSAAGSGEHHVLVELESHDGTSRLQVVPDPLVIGRDRPAPAYWRTDTAARQAGQTLAIDFDGESPFVQTNGSGRADSVLTLGPLRQAVDLERFGYAVRLLDAGGKVVSETRAAVEIRETAGPSRRVYLIAGGIGLLLLASNYLERKPLTRTYDH